MSILCQWFLYYDCFICPSGKQCWMGLLYIHLEEHCAKEATYGLLYDSDGQYCGDDQAIYCHRAVSDGDTTKESKKLTNA